MSITGAAMKLIGEDDDTPLAFTELLTPAKIAELRDLMYDDEGEPLEAPWKARSLLAMFRFFERT